MAKIAVLGYGTVGSGIVEVISRNGDLIAGRIGETLEVKYILDIRDFPGDPFADRVVHDIDVILRDPEISVVCETMGGQQPAFEFSKRALCAKKSVCTSNKELVASHGAELIELAKENGCNYLFEASVGGGIPIIRPLNTSLTAERVVDAFSVYAEGGGLVSRDWTPVWLIFAGYALVIGLLFGMVFRYKHNLEKIEKN